MEHISSGDALFLFITNDKNYKIVSSLLLFIKQFSSSHPKLFFFA